MKQNRFCLVMSLPLLILTLGAVIYELNWLASAAEIFTYFVLICAFRSKLDFTNKNILFFLGFSILAAGLKLFQGSLSWYYTLMMVEIISYAFLAKEALRYTKREAGNKFMIAFFFLMIMINVYFVYEHFQTLEGQISGMVEFGFFTMFYISLLVLSIMALVYYLNSYSRKSVYFIVLTMTIVVAGILRDMAHFYLQDTSVLLLQSFLQFGGIILIFQFFTTREKKLKLINLL